jgi:hypothetical protein
MSSYRKSVVSVDEHRAQKGYCSTVPEKCQSEFQLRTQRYVVASSSLSQTVPGYIRLTQQLGRFVRVDRNSYEFCSTRTSFWCCPIKLTLASKLVLESKKLEVECKKTRSSVFFDLYEFFSTRTSFVAVPANLRLGIKTRTSRQKTRTNRLKTCTIFHFPVSSYEPKKRFRGKREKRKECFSLRQKNQQLLYVISSTHTTCPKCNRGCH